MITESSDLLDHIIFVLIDGTFPVDVLGKSVCGTHPLGTSASGLLLLYAGTVLSRAEIA